MGHFVFELLLALLGFGCGIGLLMLALPEKRGTVRVYTPSSYCAALLAGPCVWFFDYLLWQPLTGHASSSFDNRWTIWFIGLGGTVFAWIGGRFQRLYRLRTFGWIAAFLSGAVLVVLPVFYTGWFGPGSAASALPWLCVLVLVLAAAVLFWLRRNKPSAKSSLMARRSLGVMAILAAILAVFGLALPALTDGSSGSKASAASNPSASAPPYVQRTPEQCLNSQGHTGTKDGFNVKFDKNVHQKDVSAGIDTVDTDKGRTQVLAVARHDPRYLSKIVATTPPLHQNPDFKGITKYQQLVDNGCYNQLGRDAYNTLWGLLYNPHTKLVSTTAGYGQNSGTVPNGAPYMMPAAYVTGDTRVLMVTWPDGSQTGFLHRCGNVFVPGNTPPPNVPVKMPPGHTPPPSTPPSTTPPHVCVTPPPPGSTGYKFNPQTCTWYKPAQSWDCQQNPHPGCPPNPAHQPPQSNDPTLTAQPTTVPTKAPPQRTPDPIDTASPPPPTPGGHDGGSTSQPGTTAPPHTPLPSATATGDPGGF